MTEKQDHIDATIDGEAVTLKIGRDRLDLQGDQIVKMRHLSRGAAPDA